MTKTPGTPRGWRLFFRAGWAAGRSFVELKLSMVAAGIAFYGMLALFPTIAAVIAIWGVAADPAVIQSQFELTETFLPEQAYALVERQVQALVNAPSQTLGWASGVSLGVALWSTRLGVAGLIHGLNAAYRQENRSGLWHQVAAVGVTLMLIAVALVALTAVVVVPVVLSFLPLGGLTALAVAALRWLIAVGLLVVALGVLYRFGPNRARAGTGWITPGAVMAVAVWAAVSWGFSTYLANFGSYNEVYGALGAVIALLMWLYLSAIAVLAGGLLNAEIEHLRSPRPQEPEADGENPQA